MEHLNASLACYRHIEDEFYLAKVMNDIAYCYSLMRQYDKAIDLSQQSLKLRREIGDLRGIGWCLINLGGYADANGKADEAERYWTEATEIFRDIDDKFGLGSSYFMQMFLVILRGDMVHMEELANEINRMAGLISSMTLSANAKSVMGLVAILKGNYTLGHQLCLESRDKIIMSWPGFMFLVEWGLAIAACSSEDYIEAQRNLQVALEIGLGVGSPTRMIMCLPVIARILSTSGEYERAVELLGLISTGSSDSIGWLRHWSHYEKMQLELETTLGEATYASAWDRGKDMQVATVSSDLLQQIQADADDTETRSSHPLIEPLTPRELEVLQLIYAGLDNREISERLFISVLTVKKHINHIFGKLIKPKKEMSN